MIITHSKKLVNSFSPIFFFFVLFAQTTEAFFGENHKIECQKRPILKKKGGL